MEKRFNCQYNNKLIENTNVMKRDYNRIYIIILHHTRIQALSWHSTLRNAIQRKRHKNIHPFTTKQSIFHNLYFNLLEFEWLN